MRNYCLAKQDKKAVIARLASFASRSNPVKTSKELDCFVANNAPRNDGFDAAFAAFLQN
jgi:hypothetical protein